MSLSFLNLLGVGNNSCSQHYMSLSLESRLFKKSELLVSYDEDDLLFLMAQTHISKGLPTPSESEWESEKDQRTNGKDKKK